MTVIYRRVYSKRLETPAEEPAVSRQFPTMAMTVEEMAEELHISRPTAYELVKKAAFPAFHIGNRILVNRKGLQDWIDEQCQSDPAV